MRLSKCLPLIQAPGRFEGRIWSSFKHELRDLNKLGFRRAGAVEQRLSLIAIMFRPRAHARLFLSEVSYFNPPWHFCALFPALVSADRKSVAIVRKAGIRLYSKLANGTIVVTSQTPADRYRDRSGSFVKYSAVGSPTHLARVHEENVIREVGACGKAVQMIPSLAAMASLAQAERDQASRMGDAFAAMVF